MMDEHRLAGLDGADPLAFLAALGALRVVSRAHPDARLSWTLDGAWVPSLHLPKDVDIVETLLAEIGRWQAQQPAAVAFAEGADRKIQDLKHPPAEFRALMRESVESADQEFATFVASYGTGIIVDGSGQTKPTSFHFTAGQQRFMDAVLDIVRAVTKEDLEEALFRTWEGRSGVKDLRWRAGGERNRALLSFDPSKQSAAGIVGANWLAFSALPLFPVGPRAGRLRTVGFTGSGKRERFSWCLWGRPALLVEAATLIGQNDLPTMGEEERAARGVVAVLQSAVVRSSQGYGSFAASAPL